MPLLAQQENPQIARRGLLPQPNGDLEERFVEPATLAGRVLASGEGSAEPGNAKPKTRLSHEVCDRWIQDE